MQIGHMREKLILLQSYEKLGNHEKGAAWIKKAKFYAEKYMENPSMEICSMKFCEGIKEEWLIILALLWSCLGRKNVRIYMKCLDQ